VRDGCNDIALLPVTNGSHSAEDISSNSVRQITALNSLVAHGRSDKSYFAEASANVGLQSI
jgi:hypothetical protein